MDERGWDIADIVLVTGDAYVDHPSFGVALIARWLEANGFRVAVLAQPRHHDPHEFTRFGRPRLFFGITAGNLDSIVANYTGNAKVRDKDAYSPGGNPYFGAEAGRTFRRRPDRATIRYAQLAREAYPDCPIALGGLEASLRRFAHYDFQQAVLRASVLTDSKADILIYGMGERAVLEIAKRLSDGRSLSGISGTCERLTDARLPERAAEDSSILPSLDELQGDPRLLLDAELAVDRHARAMSQVPILQRQKAMWVIQHPPQPPLSADELDALYELPFTRLPHPASGDVPAHRMIRSSITIVRGCVGNCSFCAISRHQGPVVISRGIQSIVRETESLAGMPWFDGIVSDIGGPTMNLYGTSCRKKQGCLRHDCLYPGVCPNLKIDEEQILELLDMVSGVKGIKRIFISSGLRMELLLKTPDFLERLIARHAPGAIKIAPEHTEPDVLRLMHKAGPDILVEFLKTAREIAAKKGAKPVFTPYFIAAHPGCTLTHMEALKEKVKTLGLDARQSQDFTPTPGTLSTAMFVSGLDIETRIPIYVAKKAGERRAQRLVLESIQKGPGRFRP